MLCQAAKMGVQQLRFQLDQDQNQDQDQQDQELRHFRSQDQDQELLHFLSQDQDQEKSQYQSLEQDQDQECPLCHLQERACPVHASVPAQKEELPVTVTATAQSGPP